MNGCSNLITSSANEFQFWWQRRERDNASLIWYFISGQIIQYDFYFHDPHLRNKSVDSDIFGDFLWPPPFFLLSMKITGTSVGRPNGPIIRPFTQRNVNKSGKVYTRNFWPQKRFFLLFLKKSKNPINGFVFSKHFFVAGDTFVKFTDGEGVRWELFIGGFSNENDLILYG